MRNARRGSIAPHGQSVKNLGRYNRRQMATVYIPSPFCSSRPVKARELSRWMLHDGWIASDESQAHGPGQYAGDESTAWRGSQRWIVQIAHHKGEVRLAASSRELSGNHRPVVGLSERAGVMHSRQGTELRPVGLSIMALGSDWDVPPMQVQPVTFRLLLPHPAQLGAR